MTIKDSQDFQMELHRSSTDHIVRQPMTFASSEKVPYEEMLQIVLDLHRLSEMNHLFRQLFRLRGAQGTC